MPFNYFNPSDLAIGNKIRAVFHQLYQLADSAEENIEQFSAMQEFLDEYDDRNYRVARPIQPYNPCRTDEFFNVINDKPVFINKLYYDPDKKRVYVDIILFNRISNRITRIKGDTDILEGYCYYKQASSNLNYLREPEFTEEEGITSGGLLFKYRVGSDNTVILSGDIRNLLLTPYDCSHYTKLEHGEQLAGANEEYTVKDYQCLCVVGNTNYIEVKVNDITLLKGSGHNCVRYGIFYLKPGDKISGNYSRIFEIKYIINIPQPNKYVTYYWTRLNMGVSREFEMNYTGAIIPQDEGERFPYFDEVHNFQEVYYKGSSRKTNTGFNVYRSAGIWTKHTYQEELYMCGFKFQPAKGLGVYEDEEVDTDFANFKIKGHSIAQCDWSYPGGTGKIRTDISICDSRGKKIKTIEGEYLPYKTNQRNSQWGASSDCFVGYDNEIQPEFSATFDEKIPADGYIQIDIYNKDYHYSGWSENTGLKGFKITIDEAIINLYDF